MPSSSDIKGQFWSKIFRSRIADASCRKERNKVITKHNAVFSRDTGEVDWAVFPAVTATIKEAKDGNESASDSGAVQTQLECCIDFVHKFVASMAGRWR